MKEEGLAFERLHRLANKGYVADIAAPPAGGGLMLRHPKEGPDIILRPNGAVEMADPALRGTSRADRLAIPSSDEAAFMRFVDRLPDRRKRKRRRKSFYVFLFLFFWFLSLMTTIVLLSD